MSVTIIKEFLGDSPIPRFHPAHFKAPASYIDQVIVYMNGLVWRTVEDLEVAEKL